MKSDRNVIGSMQRPTWIDYHEEARRGRTRLAGEIVRGFRRAIRRATTDTGMARVRLIYFRTR